MGARRVCTLAPVRSKRYPQRGPGRAEMGIMNDSLLGYPGGYRKQRCNMDFLGGCGGGSCLLSVRLCWRWAVASLTMVVTFNRAEVGPIES